MVKYRKVSSKKKKNLLFCNFHVLLSFFDVRAIVLLKVGKFVLVKFGEIVKVGQNGSPTLLLEMLIVNQILAGTQLISAQGTASYRQIGARE